MDFTIERKIIDRSDFTVEQVKNMVNTQMEILKLINNNFYSHPGDVQMQIEMLLMLITAGKFEDFFCYYNMDELARSKMIDHYTINLNNNLKQMSRLNPFSTVKSKVKSQNHPN